RRALWEAAEPDLLEFLCTPRERLARSRTLFDFFRRAPATLAAGPPLPAVSVVTLADVAGGDLAGTFASVAEQDPPAAEHLLVGGSPAAAPPGVRHLPLADAAVAGGEYAAMAAAVAAARGEYLLFLSAGDRLASPAALRRLFAGAPPAADVVHGHHVARDAAGVERLQLTADLSRTLAELDARGGDPDCLERLPSLSATAFRTALLRRFGFDPELRFAADLDLHRRLAWAGARSHAADAVVALCRPAREWALSLPLAAGEWLRLAVRHGAARGARRRYVGLGVEAVEAWERVLWGWIDRLRGARRRRYPLAAGGRGPRPATTSDRHLGAAVRGAARRLAAVERGAALLRPRRRAVPAGDGDEATYLASFADGVDFRRRGRPSFVARLAGISWPEGWGRWTDGPRLEIGFRRALPHRARVELEAFAHPQVAGSPIEVAIGGAAARIAFDGEPFRTHAVELETSGRETALVLTIPLPPAPPRGEAETAGERRRLGLALRRLRVVDRDDAAGT
ncbi:MAG TPA: hypothetical protein VGC93_02070, partial [Thermoanaerobaculia bacterium]